MSTSHLPTPMTFDKICAIDPHIAALWDAVRELREHPDRTSYCRDCLWYGPPGTRDGMKYRVTALVGWHSELPETSNSKVYDMVYQKLYRSLPDRSDCGHCGIRDPDK